MKLERLQHRTRRGFSLVELAVVVVIVGVLAAFGVPRLLKSVERSKAGEAFNYLGAIRTAQERYHQRLGTYASTISELDVTLPTPKYFTVGTPTASESAWSLTMTRTGAAGGYGAYTVTFTQDGYSATTSTISSEILPMGG